MSGFDDREKGYENRFVHEQQVEFKTMVRRNKLLGVWAADLMGLNEAEADAYAKEVVKSDFEEAGDEDVFRKVRGDFDARDVDQSDHQLRRKMDELMVEARRQITEED